MARASFSRPLLVGLALTLLTLAVYRPVLRYDFVNFDDGLYVSGNKTVQQGLTWRGFVYVWQTNVASNWHPVTMLSHMLDCQLYGLDARGHHLTNLVLHLATVWLLFEVLRRMTGAPWRSAFVAALFGVHPLRVESVAWIAERKDVLSGFFFVLTLAAWLRFVRSPRRPATGAYVITVLVFALGLLSKPMLVTVPAVLLLLDAWPLARLPLSAWREARQALPRLLAEKVPFFVLAAVMGGVTLYTQQHSLARLEAVSIGRRIGNALVSYTAYLGKTFWPAKLAVFYPLPPSVPAWQAGLAAALLVAVTALCLLRLRRSPWLAVGWLWFLGMLVPVIGILQVGRQGMADRYTYLPSIGLFVALVWEAAELAARRRLARFAVPVLAAAAVAALAVACRFQVTTWRDSAALFRHALAVTDRNYLAHLNLGVALSHLGEEREAEAEYRRALAIQPNMMEAHAALGSVLRRTGRAAEALPHLQRAVRLRPDVARLRHTLAIVLEDLGRRDAAIAQLRKAVELSPRFADAHYGLGTLLQKEGKTDEALHHFLIALEVAPDLTDLYAPAGALLAARGQLQPALRLFVEAVRRQPDSSVAWYNLAVTLDRLDKVAEARDAYSRALELDPGLAIARQRLEQTGGLPPGLARKALAP